MQNRLFQPRLDQPPMYQTVVAYLLMACAIFGLLLLIYAAGCLTMKAVRYTGDAYTAHDKKLPEIIITQEEATAASKFHARHTK